MRCICNDKAFDRAIAAIVSGEKSRLVIVAKAFGVSSDYVRQRVKTKEPEYPFSVDALKHTRKNLSKLSQSDAAAAVGVSFNTWQGYEHGKFRMPLHRWESWLEIVEEKTKPAKEDTW